jgi:hypothetical protein
MAPRTQTWDIGGERRRIGAQLSENSMGPVALLARRTVRIVLTHELSVDAHLILLRYLRVAGGTFNFLGNRLTRSEMRHADLGMALAT